MKISVTGSFELDFHGLKAVQADVQDINLSDNPNNSLSLIASGDLKTNNQLSTSGNNNSNNDLPAWMRGSVNVRPEDIMGNYLRQVEVDRYNLFARTVLQNQSIIRVLSHKHDIIETQRLTIAYKDLEIADKNRQIEELKRGIIEYQKRSSKGHADKHAPNTTHNSKGFVGLRTSKNVNTDTVLPPAAVARSAGLPDFNQPYPPHLEPSHVTTSDQPINLARLNPASRYGKELIDTLNASAQPNSSDAHSRAVKPAAAKADEEDNDDKNPMAKGSKKRAKKPKGSVRSRKTNKTKIAPPSADDFDEVAIMKDPILHDFPGANLEDGDKKPMPK
jgi:hypothetical protein